MPSRLFRRVIQNGVSQSRVQFQIDRDLDLIAKYAVGVFRAEVKITAFDGGCRR